MEKERSKKQNLSAKHERLKNQQMYFLEVHVAKSRRINYPIILFFQMIDFRTFTLCQASNTTDSVF